MKTMNRLTALLLGAAMLGSSMPGMPVTAADLSAVQTDTASADLQQDTRTAFFERIAGWQHASLDDCIVLGEDELLTPTKPYTISRIRCTPYRIFTKDGTAPDADAILAKWKEILRAAGYSGAVLAQFTCEITEADDGYEFRTLQDGYAGVSLPDCLKTFPDVQRIEVGRSYQTHGRVNSTSEYAVLFTVKGSDAPTPADFPELTGVTLTEQIPMTGTTKPTWNLTLASDSYADYFAAVKYLQTLNFVEQLTLGFGTDGLLDQNADASFQSSETVTVFDRSQVQGSRTEFFERIAGWQHASLDDCIVLGEDELLTPTKPYTISRIRCTPYRIFTKDGTAPDADAILAKWKEILRAAGYSGAVLAQFTCEITEADGGYEFRTLQDGYAGVSLPDCLKTFPDVQRIEAQFGYRTDDRPNTPFGYTLRFKVNGTKMPQPEDFPELTGVHIAGDVPLMTQTESTWSLNLESGRYEDYFAAAKYLLTLDFVHDLKLGYGSTELADGNDDAEICDPEPTVLYDRAADPVTPAEHTRDAFFRCISSREDVRFENCIRLGDDQLLTPKKPYTVQRSMCAPYCVYLRNGGTLDADAVLAKWKEMLLAEGYPEKTLANFTCEITAYNGGYQVRTTQDGYKSLTLADCLKTFPDVQRMETQYGYRSDDFANSAGSFVLSFTKVCEIEITASAFPELDIAEVAYKTLDPGNPNGKWYLTLNSDAYTDYYEAVKYLLTQEDVHNLRLGYAMTCLAMENEPHLTESVPAVLFNRGDLNLDGSADVADAVLLARYLASDAEAAIPDQGIVNADTDGNGKVQGDDLTVILKRIAKQY